MFQYQPDGNRVIEIDPIGQLLAATIAAYRKRGESVDVGIEAMAITGCHTGVVQPVYFADDQVLL